MEFTDYEGLIRASLGWEIAYEFSNRASHTSVRMQGTQYPNSITEPEFEIIRETVSKNNLMHGYEVATGFGLSTLAMGLGFKETGGKIVTMDAYDEEVTQNPLGDNSNIKHQNTQGFKSVCQLVEKFGLEDTVYPTVGWSPQDANTCINSIFDENQMLDFIFIDAFHTEDAVMNDFDSIKNRINKEKFVVMLHDADILPSSISYIENFLKSKGSFRSERPSGFYLYSIEST